MRKAGFTIPTLLAALLSINTAHAVWFSALIYDMPADKDFVSRPIYNDTDRTNLYNISAWKIDRPGNGGENKISDQDLEILWAPLKFSLAPLQTDYFKLYYRGPKDDKERYFRVVFKEIPLRLYPLQKTGSNLNVLPVTSMSTILVVRPRKIKLAYKVDEQKGIIENTGNTFFRVIIQKGCEGDDESSTQFYMLPGEKYQDKSVSVTNRKFIVAQDKYIKLGNGCFHN